MVRQVLNFTITPPAGGGGVINVTLSADRTSIQVGEQVTFNVQWTGGTPPYSAVLRDTNSNSILASASNISSMQMSARVTFSVQGTYRIVAEVTDSQQVKGTSNTVTITVQQSPPPPPPPPPPPSVSNVRLSVDRTTIILGESVNLSSSWEGGEPPFTWVLKTTSGTELARATTSSRSITATFTPSSAQTYYLVAVVTDKNGSSATSNTVTITVQQQQQKQPLKITSFTALAGIPTGIQGKWEGGASPFEVQVFDGLVTIYSTRTSNREFATTVVLSRGTHTLALVVTDKDGDQARATTTVTIT